MCMGLRIFFWIIIGIWRCSVIGFLWTLRYRCSVSPPRSIRHRMRWSGQLLILVLLRWLRPTTYVAEFVHVLLWFQECGTLPFLQKFLFSCSSFFGHVFLFSQLFIAWVFMARPSVLAVSSLSRRVLIIFFFLGMLLMLCGQLLPKFVGWL